MSNTRALPVRPSATSACPVHPGVRRTAFYLESQRQWLFAWLHRLEQAAPSDHGVVICPPVGHEQVHSHRSLRHLADALAEAAFPVVRFDYHGTGDSGGSGEDPEQIATWLGNIRDVGLWLKEQLGCRRLTLIGLRLGATLAALAAASEEVDGLFLWAPVVKGRSYVRELKALSLTAAGTSRPSSETPRGIEAAGFVLTEQTALELSRLDLLQCRPRCRRILVGARDDIPTDTSLREHFQALGIEAEQAVQPGYADMMAEPHANQVPWEAIARAVAWLRAGTRAGDGTDEALATNHVRRAANSSPQAPSAGYTILDDQLIRERVLAISKEPNLFGIVSELPNAALDHLPFIVMTNAGSSYRVGPNRLYVSLARQLAARGFRCLRMDLCGLGDSLARESERENDPYPATAFRDIDLTFQYLRSQLGVQRVVLMGLCSGAYAAFQAAAQLSDRVLVESVLINPLTFFWREGMSLDAPAALEFQSFWHCLKSLCQPGKWLRFLSGRSKIGIARVIGMLVKRWRRRQTAAPQAAAGWRDTTLDNYPSHPLKEDLPGDIERVVQAGRHLSCFFARADPGYGILTLHARRQVNELRRAGRMSVYFVEEADHTFSRRAPRGALGQAITEHLGRRYRRSTE